MKGTEVAKGPTEKNRVPASKRRTSMEGTRAGRTWNQPLGSASGKHRLPPVPGGRVVIGRNGIIAVVDILISGVARRKRMGRCRGEVGGHRRLERVAEVGRSVVSVLVMPVLAAGTGATFRAIK